MFGKKNRHKKTSLFQSNKKHNNIVFSLNNKKKSNIFTASKNNKSSFFSKKKKPKSVASKIKKVKPYVNLASSVFQANVNIKQNNRDRYEEKQEIQEE